MKIGPENPHFALHNRLLRLWDDYCHGKQQGSFLIKMIKETVEKTGSGPREKMESFWISTIFPKNKKFMQVGRAGCFPTQCSWLNLRRKIPWTCSISMYPSVTSMSPHIHKVCLGMGKCPRNCLPVQPHPPTHPQAKGICLWFPTSPQRRSLQNAYKV